MRWLWQRATRKNGVDKSNGYRFETIQEAERFQVIDDLLDTGNDFAIFANDHNGSTKKKKRDQTILSSPRASLWLSARHGHGTQSRRSNCRFVREKNCGFSCFAPVLLLLYYSINRARIIFHAHPAPYCTAALITGSGMSGRAVSLQGHMPTPRLPTRDRNHDARQPNRVFSPCAERTLATLLAAAVCESVSSALVDRGVVSRSHCDRLFSRWRALHLWTLAGRARYAVCSYFTVKIFISIFFILILLCPQRSLSQAAKKSLNMVFTLTRLCRARLSTTPLSSSFVDNARKNGNNAFRTRVGILLMRLKNMEQARKIERQLDPNDATSTYALLKEKANGLDSGDMSVIHGTVLLVDQRVLFYQEQRMRSAALLMRRRKICAWCCLHGRC